MKSANSPLLFLGACRITYGLGAHHGESPCGRGAEGTPQGARPSEEGWDRSECRCKAQALWSHPAERRIRDGSSRLCHGSVAALPRLCHGSSRLCHGSTPANSDIRLISVTKPRSPARNLTCSRLEVLWITACALSALPLAPPPHLPCSAERRAGSHDGCGPTLPGAGHSRARLQPELGGEAAGPS